ncbi:MAG: hypothetical protein E7262_10705 [Lachnospiraceae bacterium]|nr:hypothetical protein [Lachnospiraceae bacterium]
MTEAEVILRFAMYYIKNDLMVEDINVSIDGAHIRTGDIVHFDIFSFLSKEGFIKLDKNLDRWQGKYSYNQSEKILLYLAHLE